MSREEGRIRDKDRVVTRRLWGWEEEGRVVAGEEPIRAADEAASADLHNAALADRDGYAAAFRCCDHHSVDGRVGQIGLYDCIERRVGGLDQR